jgi:D-3-phosphoglycerate dehydrogenase
MARILVCESLGAEGLAILKQHAGFLVDVALNLSKAELIQQISDYDCILVRSQTSVDKELINAGKNLKLIGRAGVGTNNIDTACAKERGIAVINTPSGNSISTAEFAFGLMLALARDIPSARAHVQAGLWSRSQFVGQELAYKTLGIVGFGNVGKLLAVRAQAFAMQVGAFDPLIQESSMSDAGVKKLTLPELLSSSDIISLHCGLNSHTEHIINEAHIGLMKPGAMLINTARGELVDEHALLQALERGHLSKAAIDVYKKEPPAKENSLINHPKIIATPHLGASTQEAQKRVATLLAEQTIGFFTGQANLTRVV